MGVSKNRVFSPQIINFNRVFHYKPSILLVSGRVPEKESPTETRRFGSDSNGHTSSNDNGVLDIDWCHESWT